MNKKESKEAVCKIIGNSLFWKEDSPYSIEDVGNAIVDFFEVHPVHEPEIAKLFDEPVSCVQKNGKQE